jgi:DNA-directed RNA polymerase specialized sigma24 family protein
VAQSSGNFGVCSNAARALYSVFSTLKDSPMIVQPQRWNADILSGEPESKPGVPSLQTQLKSRLVGFVRLRVRCATGELPRSLRRVVRAWLDQGANGSQAARVLRMKYSTFNDRLARAFLLLSNAIRHDPFVEAYLDL